MQKKAGGQTTDPFQFRSLVNRDRDRPGAESEPRDSLAESAHLARNGVLVEHAARDAAGQLGTYLDTPTSLDAQQIDDCLQEEGWILGA